MAILRVRDENGTVHGIRALKGEAGAGVHVGSYVGDGDPNNASIREIDLGVPNVSAVLIMENSEEGHAVLLFKGQGITDAFLADGEGYYTTYLYIQPHSQSEDGSWYWRLNQKGVTYRYLAFAREVAE